MVGTAKNIKYGQGREALLEATVRVVAERGLSGLSFRAVAEMAGVNNTLISHHFGTKDALLHEAVRWATTRAIRLSDLSATETIDADFAASLVALVAGEPHLQLFQYEFVLASRRMPELRAEAVELYEGYVEALAQALRRQGHENAQTLARAVFAALDGLVFQQLTVVDGAAARDAIECIGQLLRDSHGSGSAGS